MRVHSALPASLTAAAAAVLDAAGVEHVAHGDGDTMRAAERAAGDDAALALLGPYRSADVHEALAATAPAGLPVLAPVATWTGLTRAGEPHGEEDEAPDPRGTLLRLVARDTEVARRIAADLRAAGRRAAVVAGAHDYGRQLAAQLRLAGLDEADEDRADVVVLAGLGGHPEVARARALGRPVVAFDGIGAGDLGESWRIALPFAPVDGLAHRDVLLGVERARHAAEFVARGHADRAALLDGLRAGGLFDEHGDLVDPPVWLWRAGGDGALVPDRPL